MDVSRSDNDSICFCVKAEEKNEKCQYYSSCAQVKAYCYFKHTGKSVLQVRH